MFLMIFVNDLAGAGKVVPDWMVHFSDRHHGGSGMTFVDLVFPAFLFIVGMSIPFALGRRLAKGESTGAIVLHVLVRTLSLLAIGVMMVHETPSTAQLGWSGSWWCVLMYLAAIAAFCSISPPVPPGKPPVESWRIGSLALRITGLLGSVWLAVVFRGPQGQRIISLAPLSIHTSWYGILGLIGWAYLVTSIVFIAFGQHRTAILGSMALLMCLFAAERGGLFEGFWLEGLVGIGGTLGSLPAIAVGGLLLGLMLSSPESTSLGTRTRFTLWFVAGCAAAALLLAPTYGISKNQATPSWCFWSCAITATLWFGFHLLTDAHHVKVIARPLVLAGENVLLAYLISEMLPGLLEALGWSNGYGGLAATRSGAITRSAACGVAILTISTGLNRVGFRLRL
jgi:heparan-alpha-glucosaminide N-acetyltransferase